MRLVRRFVRGLVAVIGICAIVVAIAVVLAPFLLPMVTGVNPDARDIHQGPTGPITGEAYSGDPGAEAGIVSAEKARIVDVRAAAATAIGAGIEPGLPFRVLTEPRATLVLPARSEPYTLAEVASTASDCIGVTADGSYLVKEHVAILEGATLDVGAGEKVLLASDASGFSSLVALGGTLEISGTPEHRVQVTSWDPGTGSADLTTADGRAYVQVNRGVSGIANADFTQLGFWSGPTGGLAFMGDEHPRVEPGEAVPNDAGPAAMPITEAGAPDLVNAKLSAVTVTGNAYGIYAARAESVAITGSTVTSSLVDGIVFDQGVDSASVEDSSSSQNAVDGIVVSHAGVHITFKELTATGNGRNGLTLNGLPLADGPNTSGDDVTSFGGYAVRGGTFADNARYGIEVLGGTGATISGTQVRGGDMGIVLSKGAREVAMIDNIVNGTVRHGIAIRDHATGIRASGNRITGASVGIYARSSEVSLLDNTIEGARTSGITVVGSMRNSQVFDNDISGAGSGETAIDSARALDARIENNLVDGWVASRSLQQMLATIFQPLTILWSVILAAVSLAVFWRLGRGPRGIPQPERAPLQSMSRGVFTREAAEVLRP